MNSLFKCTDCIDYDLCCISCIKTDFICEFFVLKYNRNNSIETVDDLISSNKHVLIYNK